MVRGVRRMVRSLLLKKDKETVEEKVRMIQLGNKELQDELINAYKPFIGKMASTICNRYIDESDDEFSIGLIAFNEAIHSYRLEKGRSFLSFSKLLIHYRLIDFIRSQSNQPNMSLDAVNSVNNQEHQSALEAIVSVNEYHQKVEEAKRKEEIIRFAEILQQFGLSLNELITHTPKHKNARKSAINIAKLVAENEQLKTKLLHHKRLPIKDLEAHISPSRKTIERNRKYIIAIALIYINNFIYIQDYLKGVLRT